MEDVTAQGFAQEARSESAADRMNNYTGGTETARGLLARDNFSEGLGGSPNPMREAIRSKYAGQFNRAQERLNLDMTKGANADHLRKLEVAQQMAADELKMNFEKEMQRKKLARARAAARGSVVGQVLGTVAAVVAGIYTGGSGAAAGYAAGNAVGNAIGGA